MKIVTDCGNYEYFKIRAIENIKSTTELAQLEVAIQLLVLAIATWENEHGGQNASTPPPTEG
jgi:hypothetical protein